MQGKARAVLEDGFDDINGCVRAVDGREGVVPVHDLMTDLLAHSLTISACTHGIQHPNTNGSCVTRADLGCELPPNREGAPVLAWVQTAIQAYYDSAPLLDERAYLQSCSDSTRGSIG